MVAIGARQKVSLTTSFELTSIHYTLTSHRQLQMPVSDAFEYAGELVVRNMAHTDAREGIAAFVEKRRPAWKGR
jgi:enoyl-CoA hydratase/carnithine racemase